MMPKRSDISSILVIGSGPIVIGQACEFDYSGTQGIKSLREEGYEVVLINSNPATIMTDQSLADKVYIEPVTPEFAEKVIQKERPCAVLATLGGQTALNVALKLSDSGVLDKYGVKLIGASIKAIRKAEDRELFAQAMKSIGLRCPRHAIVHSQREAFSLLLACMASIANQDCTRLDSMLNFELKNLPLDNEEAAQMEKYIENSRINNAEFFAKELETLLSELSLEASELPGIPAIVRPSLTLGGTGGGIASTIPEYIEISRSGIAASPIGQVQIDQSIIGWKEFEMEVVRDHADNVIIVCSIENLDPMGVHTGDSVTVAPSVTLTDKEYQQMRDASISVLREIGVDTGGSNVQFAINPENGEMLVIEMNPRVSRSSALASKATGFPIAKVAAKLAIGYTLPELTNDIVANLPRGIDPIAYRNHLMGISSNTSVDIKSYIDGQVRSGAKKAGLNQKVLPAAFEPSIDYIVIKVPKFDFIKFGVSKPRLGTQMQSIGEVMSFGRSFEEALMKAIDSIEEVVPESDNRSWTDISEHLSDMIPLKFIYIMNAFRIGVLMERITEGVDHKNFCSDYSIFNSAVLRCLKSALGLFIDASDEISDPRIEEAVGEYFNRNFILNFLDSHTAEVAKISDYDQWFVDRLKSIVMVKNYLKTVGNSEEFKSLARGLEGLMFSTSGTSSVNTQASAQQVIENNPDLVNKIVKTIGFDNYFHAKQIGMGDGEIRKLLGIKAGLPGVHILRQIRKFIGIRPVYKRVDTCANEFETNTNYFYSTYERRSGLPGELELTGSKSDNELDSQNEARAINGKKVVIFGSGPNRVGQGIEFDYSCVKACQALREMGIAPIMVNCNPETVSTDYDTSDRLYFEPLSNEAVMDVIENESSDGELLGAIVQFGGQTPLKLRSTLHASGVKILGMKEDAIAMCDDRGKFLELCSEIGAKRPRNFFSPNIQSLFRIAQDLSYRFIIRPSAVIGGRGMAIISSYSEFYDYLCSNHLIIQYPASVFFEILGEKNYDLLFSKKQNKLVDAFRKLKDRSKTFFPTRLEVFELLDFCRYSFDYDERHYFSFLTQEFIDEYTARKDCTSKSFSKLSQSTANALREFVNSSNTFVIFNDDRLVQINPEYSLSYLLDDFLESSIEVDVDAIRDKRGNIFIASIMEHIEYAGIHSGDSACSLPARTISQECLEEIYRLCAQFTDKLLLNGLVNIQFAIKDNSVYLIEINPRSSRTVPFVSKAVNLDLPGISAKVMLSETLENITEFKDFEMKRKIDIAPNAIMKRDVYILDNMDYFAVKEAVFSFEKFGSTDVILGPEMKSTGEVMGRGKTFGLAYAKAIVGTGYQICGKSAALLSVRDADKGARLLDIAKSLIESGFAIHATAGTGRFLQENQIKFKEVNKVKDGGFHVVKAIESGEISLVVNTTSGKISLVDSFQIRRSVVKCKVLYSTTIEATVAIVEAIREVKQHGLELFDQP